jgi:catechol 2,3-dioxygenase-like lactoylglutathione lyase family enzyme
MADQGTGQGLHGRDQPPPGATVNGMDATEEMTYMTGEAAEDASALPATGTAIHHTVVVVRDIEVSLRFYRDGLGLGLLQDRHVEGDWPGLFDAPSRGLRAVFLGDARVPDDHAGVLELNVFDGDVPAAPPLSPPRTGFFLLSFFVDVEATLSRLATLGLGGPPRRVTQPTPNGPITLATVRDPDGLLVLLTPGSITRQGSG